VPPSLLRAAPPEIQVIGGVSDRCATLARMRPSPLLLLAPLAALALSACAGLPRWPDATASLATGAPAEGAEAPGSAETASAEQDPSASNPTESADHSTSLAASEAAPASLLLRPEVQTMMTGVALTGVGVLSTIIGGVLLGWGGGVCRSANDSCAEGVVLPILGALWIGAGVPPLIMGVSLWVPTTPKTPVTSKTSGAPPLPQKPVARPALLIGPAGAGVRWDF
jgi:hypothetical protein